MSETELKALYERIRDGRREMEAAISPEESAALLYGRVGSLEVAQVEASFLADLKYLGDYWSRILTVLENVTP